MFKSNGDEEYSNPAEIDDTVIGHSIKIEGDLISNGSIVVEGEVNGSVKTEQSLRIGERAKVKAEINAKDAFIAGRVDGNILVKEKLELAESAEVNGDIEAQTLSISSGAVFNGRCSMTDGGKKNIVSESERSDSQDDLESEG